jgi:hypothetical protein
MVCITTDDAADLSVSRCWVRQSNPAAQERGRIIWEANPEEKRGRENREAGTWCLETTKRENNLIQSSRFVGRMEWVRASKQQNTREGGWNAKVGSVRLSFFAFDARLSFFAFENQSTRFSFCKVRVCGAEGSSACFFLKLVDMTGN